jgi:hypothetical protein
VVSRIALGGEIVGSTPALCEIFCHFVSPSSWSVYGAVGPYWQVCVPSWQVRSAVLRDPIVSASWWDLYVRYGVSGPAVRSVLGPACHGRVPHVRSVLQDACQIFGMPVV